MKNIVRFFWVSVDISLAIFLFFIYLFYMITLKFITYPIFRSRNYRKKVLLRITSGAAFDDLVRKFGEKGVKELFKTEVNEVLADEIIVVLIQAKKNRKFKLFDYLEIIESTQMFKGTIFQMDFIYLVLQFFYLGTIIFSKNVKVVWATDPFGAFIIGYWIAQVNNAKVILSQATDYSVTGVYPKYAKLNIIRRITELFSYKNCSFFVARCLSYLRSIKKEYGEILKGKTKVIYPPYNFNQLEKEINIEVQTRLIDKFGLKGKNIILTVSRLSSEKYVEDILEVARILNKFAKRMDVVFVIIGDGPLREKLSMLVKEYNLNVILTGFLPRKEVYNFLKLSMVYFSPLTGLALIEAMYCENYVIAYNIDLQPEYITKYTGKLVKFRDYKGVASEIKSFFTIPEKYKRNIMKAKELVVKRNDVYKVSKKLYEVFWN